MTTVSIVLRKFAIQCATYIREPGHFFQHKVPVGLLLHLLHLLGQLLIGPQAFSLKENEHYNILEGVQRE
jgi:hypothetical protein